MENKDDLNNLSVDEIRNRLNAFGLPSTGTKSDLINRLYDAYEAENDEESRMLNDARKQMALEQQKEKSAYDQDRWNQSNANTQSGYMSSMIPMPPNSMSMMHPQNSSMHSNQNILPPGVSQASLHENLSSHNQAMQNQGQPNPDMSPQGHNIPPPFQPQSQGMHPQNQMMPPPHGFPPPPPKHIQSSNQNIPHSQGMQHSSQNMPPPTSQGMTTHQGILPPGHGMPPPPPPMHQRMPLPPPSQRMSSHQGLQQSNQPPLSNQNLQASNRVPASPGLHNANQRMPPPPPNQNMHFSSHRMPPPPQGMASLNQRMPPPPPPPPNRSMLPPGIPPPIPGMPPSSQSLHMATSNQNMPPPGQNISSSQTLPPPNQSMPLPSHMTSSNYLPPNQNMHMPPPSSTGLTVPSQSLAISHPSQEMPPKNLGIPPPNIRMPPPNTSRENISINKDIPPPNLMNTGHEMPASDQEKLNLPSSEIKPSDEQKKNDESQSQPLDTDSKEKDNSQTNDSSMENNISSTPPGVPPPSSSNQSSSDQIVPPASSQETNSQNQETSVQDANKPPSLMSLNVAKPSEQGSKDIALPQALEKALAFKDERAQQLGVDPDEVQPMIVEEESKQTQPSQPKSLVQIDDDEEEGEIKSKESKNKKRKKKKKQRKARQQKQNNENKEKEEEVKDKKEEVEIEYIQEAYTPSDPAYFQFVRIFEKFKLQEPEKPKEQGLLEQPSEGQKQVSRLIERKKPADIDEDDDIEVNKEDEKVKLSKKKLKKLTRMSIADLKKKVVRPDLVEMHDVTAKDPVLLLHLKATRNTVPVPRHWCFKRKYLQGKRGIEKPPFQLPDFIKKTGIMEMRQALQEKEEQKTLKSKMRERVRPKLGKIDIDYQKLHDAFFKWQTKPKMTIHGDLYYEGKEFETRLREKKPGDLSEELRVALGMPTGPNAHKCPPPWLIAMQRYGPPPSYPNFKIPGLNAPIPEGCSFGYHAGGWGKPPVDESGRPLYGDVFGTQITENQPNIPEEDFDRSLWGEMESESSEEEEDEELDGDKEDETGLVTPAEGLVTPSGFSSIPAGMETPESIEIRKRKIEAEMEGGDTPALYTILPEKKVEKIGAAMMGSTHIYDVAASAGTSKQKVNTTFVPNQGVEVALDPNELEMDPAQMTARYEQGLREQQSQLAKEDLSDMVAEYAARQKNKRKKQQQDGGKAKKYKEFKF